MTMILLKQMVSSNIHAGQSSPQRYCWHSRLTNPIEQPAQRTSGLRNEAIGDYGHTKYCAQAQCVACHSHHLSDRIAFDAAVHTPAAPALRTPDEPKERSDPARLLMHARRATRQVPVSHGSATEVCPGMLAAGRVRQLQVLQVSWQWLRPRLLLRLSLRHLCRGLGSCAYVPQPLPHPVVATWNLYGALQSVRWREGERQGRLTVVTAALEGGKPLPDGRGRR